MIYSAPVVLIVVYIIQFAFLSVRRQTKGAKSLWKMACNGILRTRFSRCARTRHVVRSFAQMLSERYAPEFVCELLFCAGCFVISLALG